MLILLLTLVFLMIASTTGFVLWRAKRARERTVEIHGYGPPIVVFPPSSSVTMTPVGRTAAVRPPVREPELRRESPEGLRAANEVEEAAAQERVREVERRLHIEQELEAAQASSVAERPVLRRVRDNRETEAPDVPRPSDVDGALALASAAGPDANPVRMLVPPGGTLQMLPGRLVLLEGEEAGREIRFVRLGGNPQRVTLGRNAGRPYEHVQLRAQTVSRVHAQMQYDEGRWYVENLSRTNPLVVNGRAVAAGGAPTPLSEGDVIELGEVMCRFHER